MNRYISIFLVCMFISGSICAQSKSSKPKAKVPATKAKPLPKAEAGILLVKVKSPVIKHQVGALDIRSRIEDKIDEMLAATKNGEWVSGDSGPGEVNMLFNVKDIQKAIPAILKVINLEKFDKTIIMGVKTGELNGRYTFKPVFPAGYKGEL